MKSFVSIPPKRDMIEMLSYCKEVSEEVFGPIKMECEGSLCDEDDCVIELNEVSLQVCLTLISRYLGDNVGKNVQEFLGLN
jgi:hypothetical protein